MSQEPAAALDSIVLFRNSQGEEAQGTLMRLSRSAVLMEVYNPYSIVQLSEVLDNVRIKRGGRDIYSGGAVVTNLVSTGLLLIVSASLVDPWSDVTDLAPGPQLREEIGTYITDWSDANRQLHSPYQVVVSNISNFLAELSRWLDHSETLIGITESDVSPDLRNEFVEDVEVTVADKLDELFSAFEQEVREVPEDKVAVHKAFARRELHPLIMCSPFIHRTFTKPLGYAGDYEMVNMILRDRFVGNNTYAKIINSMLLRSGTAQAHRNRIDKLVDYLRSSRVFRTSLS